MAKLAIERAVVLGAGALGSFLGARLSSVIPVRLVGRAAHVEAIRESGLRVSGDIDLVADVEATEEIGTLAPATLVLVTVKLYDLESACAQLAGELSAGSVVMPVMNGLHPEHLLRERLGGGLSVIRGVAMCGATLEGPGHVSYWGGGLTLEPTERSAELRDLVASAGIDCDIAADYEALAWSKFAVNCVWNPLTAILGVRNSRIVTPQLRSLRRRVIDECVAVARAEGVALPADFAATTDRALAESENRSSMLQDIARRPRTENDWLSGDLVRLADAHGIAAPASELLRDLVAAIESRPVAERTPVRMGG